MGGFIALVIAVMVIVGTIVSAIRRVARQVVRSVGEKPWESLTPVERSVQRELEKYIRGQKCGTEGIPASATREPSGASGPMERALASRRAAPPPVPPPAAPVPVPARQAVAGVPKMAQALASETREGQPRVTPPRQRAVPAPPPGGPAAPRRRPLRINARVMRRVAILSEIWRRPLALRDRNPWDRS